MPRALRLETFSSTTPVEAAQEREAIRAAERKAAWDDGHAAGLAAGTEAAAQVHAEDQARLRHSLVEALKDQKLRQLEAHHHVLQDILPFVRSLIGHLTPRLASASLADHIGEAVTRALEARPDPVPIVRCAPEALASLEIALADWEGLMLITDPALTPLEAEVHWDNGFDAINVAAVLNHIDSALAELGSPLPDRLDGPATGLAETKDTAHAG